MSGTIRVTQVKSAIGYNKKQRLHLKGLGLRRLQHTVEVQDTPAIRGLITKVAHLVKVEE